MAEGQQLLDERGDRRPGQPDAGRHPGAGHLALLQDGTQDQAEVVAAHGLGSGLGAG